MEGPKWNHFDCDRCLFICAKGRVENRFDIYRCGSLWLIRYGDGYEDFAAVGDGTRDAYIEEILASDH